MKGKNLLKALMIGLMAVVFILPSLAGAAEKAKQQASVIVESSKTTIGSEVINQEVVQILRKGDMSKVTMNIAGQPGVYFKIDYSETAEEGSYKPLPNGKGVIGSNGFGSVNFDLSKLGKEEVYLKVTTSDTKDFSQPRVMPKPLVFLVDKVKIKDRGLTEDYINSIKQKINEKNRFNGAGAVRG